MRDPRVRDPRVLLPETTIPADFLGGLLDRHHKTMFQWQETCLRAWTIHDRKQRRADLADPKVDPDPAPQTP